MARVSTVVVPKPEFERLKAELAEAKEARNHFEDMAARERKNLEAQEHNLNNVVQENNDLQSRLYAAQEENEQLKEDEERERRTRLAVVLERDELLDERTRYVEAVERAEAVVEAARLEAKYQGEMSPRLREAFEAFYCYEDRLREENERLSANPDWTAYNALQDERDYLLSRLAAAGQVEANRDSLLLRVEEAEDELRRAEKENKNLRIVLETREDMVDDLTTTLEAVKDRETEAWRDLQSRLSRLENEVAVDYEMWGSAEDAVKRAERAEAVVEAARRQVYGDPENTFVELVKAIRRYEEGK